ncbi:P1 family peptidase, partial [Nocardia brasiliensis]|uniref:P1 family peptidase n=1 Tax=Nocardia brasiliensis TaxID=37326 RepID=UPI002457D7B4
ALFYSPAAHPTARPPPYAAPPAPPATPGELVPPGRVGAGTGAYTGHWRGPGARRAGGLAYTERRWNDLVVGALCVVNAFGDIDDGAAEISLDPVTQLDLMISAAAAARMHTTIGTVITNPKLYKVGCHIVALGAHDGLSRALTPPHGRFDGDGFIAAATGSVDADVDLVRLMALATVTDAIRSVATAPQ